VTQAVDPSSGRDAAPAGSGPSGAIAALLVGVLLVAGSALAVRSWTSSAGVRLTTPEAEKPKVAVADQAEVAYCTAQFKQVLERVLHSCGLSGEGEGDRRGCKPADVKTFASISDDDFNALFTPLKDRGGVVMFDEGRDDLDDSAKKLLEERWFARKGARYFFVVARASKTGNQAKNRALSHRRANSVMYFLTQQAGDPEIEKKVGLLWLGNEFAQLDKGYCSWPNSRPQEKCDEEPINRSAFVSWVDCRL
jgi:outer membrane protein OmpA-like peptidoglycan-associated protein